MSLTKVMNMRKIEVKLSDMDIANRYAILSKIDSVLELLDVATFIDPQMVTPDNPDTLIATFDDNNKLVSFELR